MKDPFFLRYSKKYRNIINGNRVVIVNRDSGEWMRISKECFDILNFAVEEKYTFDELISSLSDKGDKKYFRELLEKAISMGVLSDKENDDYRIETVYLILTNRCNLKCKHCCVNAENSTDNIFHMEMDTNTFKMAIDKVIQCAPDRIIISGGEPMLREDFIEILQYIRKNYKGIINLSTNALLINSSNVKEIVKNVDRMDISIDGVDEETCSVIRGKGVFDRVIKAIKLLKAESFDEIYLSMVFGDFNAGLEKKFKEMNKELGTNPIIRAFVPVGRGDDNKSIFINNGKEIQSEFSYSAEELIEAKKGTVGIRCGAGVTDLVVNYDGNVFPCANIMESSFKLFNIKEIESISEFIVNMNEQPGYLELEKLQPENFLNCKDCKVNLFCWSCLQDIKIMKENYDKFNDRCKIKKGILYPIIWN